MAGALQLKQICSDSLVMIRILETKVLLKRRVFKVIPYNRASSHCFWDMNI